MENKYILEMLHVSKEFPGVKALDDIVLKIRPGTVHSLMGENGAGKSTLMKCLFGIYLKDEGQILLDGKEISFKSSKQALENGVAMVQQELNQANKMTVLDNLWLGRFPETLGVIHRSKMLKDTAEIFKTLGLTINPRAVMSTLSVSQRQMVEIAKAVSYNAKVVVFDEPTSSLTDTEIEHLFKIINMLKEKGCGIVYISHKMEEILKISDEVTIMRDGKHISTTDAKELTVELIIKMMVGRELSNRFPPKDNVPGEEILKVEGLCSSYGITISDVSFSLKKGEILGISGLMGAGRTELLETIYGTAAKAGGKVTVHGKEVVNKNSRDAINHGFALVTEERRATGIFGVLDIKENATMANLKHYKKIFYLQNKALEKASKWVIDSMRVKTPSQKTKIASLSGGNQQKVILGRWLLSEPEVLLLDEPTRGIDVGAKYEIYQLMLNLANTGKAIIMVSSEMPELLGICDRIMVMSGGKLAGTVDAGATTQEEIMALSAKYV